jgi:hypothetical protein
MTNTDTGSASEPTPDRLTAYVYVDGHSGERFVTSNKLGNQNLYEYLGEVSFDPAALRTPESSLPSKPGVYRDRNGLTWELMASGTWNRMGAILSYDLSIVRKNAPFTRLVSERESITREQIEECAETSRNWDGTVNNILALANRADQ